MPIMRLIINTFKCMYLLFIINRLCLKTYSHVSCTLQATCSQMVINDETGTLVL